MTPGPARCPDRITIFRGPLTRMCEDREDLLDEIAVTVVHEIAHHFGIDDAPPARPRLGLTGAGADDAPGPQWVRGRRQTRSDWLRSGSVWFSARTQARALCAFQFANEYCQTPMPSAGWKTRPSR